MKKEEKIIKIRTAAKVELARINAKYAQEEADAARRKSEDLTERVGCCENERFNVIERYKALSAAIKADRLKDIAKLYENTEKLCEEATDDPEPEQEPKPETYQPTQWLNGEQWTAAVVARRILNKLPELNYTKESIYIELSPSHHGGCGLDLRYINIIDKARGITSCELLAKDTPEEQARKVDLWLKDVEVQMARAKEIMEEEREEADNE